METLGGPTTVQTSVHLLLQTPGWASFFKTPVNTVPQSFLKTTPKRFFNKLKNGPSSSEELRGAGTHLVSNLQTPESCGSGRGGPE